MLLKAEFFLYWLIFFIVVEGALLLAVIYVLTLLVRMAAGARPDVATAPAQPAHRSVLRRAIDGVVGNFAWTLVIIAALIIVKLTGLADAAVDQVLEAIGR